MHAGTAAAALRSAFFDSFTSYAVATDKLSSEIAGHRRAAAVAAADGDDSPAAAAAPEAENDGIGADCKVLVLLSNCAFVRGNIMPSFAERCASRARPLTICDGAPEWPQCCS